MSLLIAVDRDDAGELTDDLLRVAAAHASATGEPVHLLSVVPRERTVYQDMDIDFRDRIEPFTGGFMPIDPPKRTRERYATTPELREKRLAALRSLASRHLAGIRHDEYVATGDDVAESILEAARRLHADSIVIGSRSHSRLHRALKGSVSQDVIERSPVPVVVIRGGAR